MSKQVTITFILNDKETDVTEIEINRNDTAYRDHIHLINALCEVGLLISKKHIDAQFKADQLLNELKINRQGNEAPDELA